MVAGLGPLAGCSTTAAGLQVGDCLRVGGAVDRPETREVACDGSESNFKVVAIVPGAQAGAGCPSDVDSYFSQRGGITDAGTTVCLDIDWTVGRCMSVHPERDTDTVQVECSDASVPDRQRATQILTGIASVDQCASGQGYAYRERLFTVCVERL